MDATISCPDKEFATIRARAARLGMLVYRTDASDGRVAYFSEFHGVAKRHIDLTALESRVQDLEAEAT